MGHGAVQVALNTWLTNGRSRTRHLWGHCRAWSVSNMEYHGNICECGHSKKVESPGDWACSGVASAR